MSFLKDKVVLVTGAGGSIGSEICRQISLLREPKKLILFDNCELNLFKIDRELSAPNVVPVLGDVSCIDDTAEAFAHGVDVVYHAAAYKHVTLCEKNPVPARHVNVRGTARIVGWAKAFRVPRLVLVSTDKAVRPSCVMGETKQEAEKIVRDAGYTVIRLGNVRGSSGSVLTLWREQIAKGEPVTITDPYATRYFISVGQAAEHIIAAATYGPGTFVPEMGEPVSLGKLALQMGAKNFNVIGLRPGEKMHEELSNGPLYRTDHPGVWKDAA